MIRPFGLRDILAVRQLQRQGVWLDLYHYLLHRQSPLMTALISPVPWWGTGLASYVWSSGVQAQGFIQVLKRPGRPEADILFLAPGFQQVAGDAQIWRKLLAYCVRSATDQDIRRLFASLPRDSAEIEPLIELGFAVYSNQDVYQLTEAGQREAPPFHRSGRTRGNGRIRRQSEEDAWWLRRLYSLYTPAPVQHAEGMNDNEEPTAVPLPWWELSHQQSFVLVEGNEVHGGVQVVSGWRGHWLLLYGDHGNAERMRILMQQGLHALAGKRWPVYCAVRDYQGGLPAVLEDQGFRLFTSRSRLVKHMLATVKAPGRASVPSLAIEQSP